MKRGREGAYIGETAARVDYFGAGHFGLLALCEGGGDCGVVVDLRGADGGDVWAGCL